VGDDERVTVVEDPLGGRYVAGIDGETVGVAEYRRKPDRTVFTHTEIDPGHEGRGVGSTLVRAALDAERAAGRSVEPRCPFVARWIGSHPDYADLVPDRYRSLLER
jgi:predicted GNAT family acetyltransferase